ncbi:MAG TPA: tyrosine-protein phosphatase [Candidatus Stackebrandtia faecavium]|nr:tyrosine-protein phosphatase [Candidatus Stackebrandtia faecavium]
MLPPSGSEPEDPRFVPLESVFNFRDLGGLVTREGARVRPGRVFRSDQFACAQPHDLNRLVNDLGLRTVVDLRRKAEIDDHPAFPSGYDVVVHHLELKHIPWHNFERDIRHESDQAVFLGERYTAMLETGADAIRGTLELLRDDTPLVFHCMAGKDRTGIVSAVVLGLLGVDHETIANDYMLSSHGIDRFSQWREDNGLPAIRARLLEIEAMRTMLRNIDTYFGSVDAYARAIGFNDASTLRGQLLD